MILFRHCVDIVLMFWYYFGILGILVGIKYKYLYFPVIYVDNFNFLERSWLSYSRDSQKWKMCVKECFCPDSLDQALDYLKQYDSLVSPCAGGTDLLVMMRKGKSVPRYLMDLSNLALSYIQEHPDHISIGAMTTLSEVEVSPLLMQEPYKALQCAAGWVGSPQIRNVATLVGNICTGISSADAAPPLLTLDARVRIAGQDGMREVPITEFFVSPRKTVVAPDELACEILLPKLPAKNAHTFFRKVGTRKELFISIFNMAALLNTDGDRVESVRIAMGLMAPVPIRLYQTETLLTGNRLTPQVIDQAIAVMAAETSPRTSYHASKEYRTTLAENMLRRYLSTFS